MIPYVKGNRARAVFNDRGGSSWMVLKVHCGMGWVVLLLEGGRLAFNLDSSCVLGLLSVEGCRLRALRKS